VRITVPIPQAGPRESAQDVRSRQAAAECPAEVSRSAQRARLAVPKLNR